MSLNIDLTGRAAILKGETFTLELQCVDANGAAIDLTGYTVEALIKRSYEDADIEALLTLTTANSRIIITPLLGKVMWYLTDEETSQLDWTTAVHFTRLTSSAGDTTYLADGSVQAQAR